ncbi:MAG: hypothetical protein WDN48_16145 [Pseudolabrys sp.]
MKFPKQLFVKLCDDGSGNEYFDPHRIIDTTVDAGEREKVAVYDLREVVEARGSVTVVTHKGDENADVSRLRSGQRTP